MPEAIYSYVRWLSCFFARTKTKTKITSWNSSSSSSSLSLCSLFGVASTAMAACPLWQTVKTLFCSDSVFLLFCSFLVFGFQFLSLMCCALSFVSNYCLPFVAAFFLILSFSVLFFPSSSSSLLFYVFRFAFLHCVLRVVFHFISQIYVQLLSFFFFSFLSYV